MLRRGWEEVVLKSSSSSSVSLGGRAGRQAGSRVCLACDHSEAGSCLLFSEGLQATFCSPSLFLEQTFPGRADLTQTSAVAVGLGLLKHENLASVYLA